MTVWVGMEWMKQQTGYKSEHTIKKRILYPNREEIEEFAYYPKKHGEHWKFSREHMEKWLKDNAGRC